MRIIVATFALFALGQQPSRAEDGATSLFITVHPSGVEAGAAGETLDQKLARRERSFRFICLGCLRADGPVDTTTPFRPIATLNAPQLTAALASEARSVRDSAAPLELPLPDSQP